MAQDYNRGHDSQAMREEMKSVIHDAVRIALCKCGTVASQQSRTGGKWAESLGAGVFPTSTSQLSQNNFVGLKTAQCPSHY